MRRDAAGRVPHLVDDELVVTPFLPLESVYQRPVDVAIPIDAPAVEGERQDTFGGFAQTAVERLLQLVADHDDGKQRAEQPQQGRSRGQGEHQSPGDAAGVHGGARR